MNLIDDLISRLDNNSPLKQRLTSPRFQLSQEILGARIRLYLTPAQAAQRLRMSEEQYRGFENAINLTADIRQYEKVLDKLLEEEGKQDAG